MKKIILNKFYNLILQKNKIFSSSIYYYKNELIEKIDFLFYIKDFSFKNGLSGIGISLLKIYNTNNEQINKILKNIYIEYIKIIKEIKNITDISFNLGISGMLFFIYNYELKYKIEKSLMFQISCF